VSPEYLDQKIANPLFQGQRPWLTEPYDFLLESRFRSGNDIWVRCHQVSSHQP